MSIIIYRGTEETKTLDIRVGDGFRIQRHENLPKERVFSLRCSKCYDVELT